MADSLESMVCRTDPGVGEVITVRTPVFGITFHIEETDPSSLLQLHEAVMSLIGEDLNHHMSGNMEKPGRLTPRARTILPTWFRKPNWRQAGRVFSLQWGGEDLGVGVPSLEVAFGPEKKKTEKQYEEIHQNRLGREHREDHHCGVTVAVGLPIDHPLAEADALHAWLAGLEVVRTGEYAFLESGYRLLSYGDAFSALRTEDERLLSRYPGLDYLEPWQTRGLFRFDPHIIRLVPLVKRANWTVGLHQRTVDYLGGAAKLREQLADTPEVLVHDLPHGLLIQAGKHPQLGDLNTGDYLPLQRKVAQVLRPARVETMPAERGEFWEHFFTIFDKDYG